VGIALKIAAEDVKWTGASDEVMKCLSGSSRRE